MVGRWNFSPHLVGHPILKDGRVRLNEQPDWSLVAETFKGFIPVCKTIADIEGTEVRYRALTQAAKPG